MTMLSTIGYEGASLGDFLSTLHRAGIKQVVDIRDVPVSRRPGFSKNVLARALEEEGLSYLHLKALGDPKPGREAAREGRYEAFRAIYGEHLDLTAGQDALRVAVDAAIAAPSVLLCYERDCRHCHRTIVAQAMTQLYSFHVRHLGVQKATIGLSVKQRGSVEGHGAVSIA